MGQTSIDNLNNNNDDYREALEMGQRDLELVEPRHRAVRAGAQERDGRRRRHTALPARDHSYITSTKKFGFLYPSTSLNGLWLLSTGCDPSRW